MRAKTLFILFISLFINTLCWSQEKVVLSSTDTMYVVKSGLNNYTFYFGDQEIDYRDLASLFREDNKAYRYYLIATTVAVSSVVIQFIGGCLVGVQLTKFLTGFNHRWDYAIVGGATILIAATFLRRIITKNVKKAVKAYNESNSIFVE